MTSTGIKDIDYSGFGITPEYRFYFAGEKEAMNGIYAAPFLRMQFFKLKNETSGIKTSYTSFGGGATLGWEKVWPSGFMLDLFAGPIYNAGDFKSANKSDFKNLTFGIDGLGLKAGAYIGFAF